MTSMLRLTLGAAAWRRIGDVRDKAMSASATPSLVQTNRAFQRMLRDGVEVEYPRDDGSIKGDKVRLVDFGDEGANDYR